MNTALYWAEARFISKLYIPPRQGRKQSQEIAEWIEVENKLAIEDDYADASQGYQ